MQKMQSSFKIIFLLYIIVLILPFSFYFVYASFKTMQEDTKIVRQSSWVAGAIGQNVHTKDVETSLQNISEWAHTNADTKLYIGAQTLKEDLAKVSSCLSTKSHQCYTLADTMALNIEKMVYLKQNKLINMFYLSLSLAMILLILVIYLIRVYIHKQMKKHAIHDHESTLFNHKYFSSELKSTCARAVRHAYPLSIMKIEIEGFEKESTQYDTRTKLNVLKAFGTLMYALVRDGDLPSRYDENHFLILLPYANEENALLFEQRVRQALMKDDCIISENIQLNFTITEFNKEETNEAFVQRSLDT